MSRFVTTRAAWGPTVVRLWLAAALAAVVGTACLGGCGEKIDMPKAADPWGLAGYFQDTTYVDVAPLQIASREGVLFVLTADSLTKRGDNYGRSGAVGGLAGPAALCVDRELGIVFVWEAGAGRVSWFAGTNLALLGTSELPDVQSVTGMATAPAGVDGYGLTFLYLSDPEAGVIHRYVFDAINGLYPFGILARADGAAARFVHVPAGMARDSEDSLLVCDIDSARNWVIRFNSAPDSSDVTADPDDIDPMRGLATTFDIPTCEPPAAEEYVLGYAADCDNAAEWEGGISDEGGYFANPEAVTVDGLGRIFVADTNNGRVQVFSARGEYDNLKFQTGEDGAQPVSLAVIDDKWGFQDDEYDYGAYVYVILRGDDRVIRYISVQKYIRDNQQPPDEKPQ